MLHLSQRRREREVDGNARRVREGVRHARLLLHATDALARVVAPPLLPLGSEEGDDLLVRARAGARAGTEGAGEGVGQDGGQPGAGGQVGACLGAHGIKKRLPCCHTLHSCLCRELPSLALRLAAARPSLCFAKPPLL